MGISEWFFGDDSSRLAGLYRRKAIIALLFASILPVILPLVPLVIGQDRRIGTGKAPKAECLSVALTVVISVTIPAVGYFIIYWRMQNWDVLRSQRIRHWQGVWFVRLIYIAAWIAVLG